MHHYGYVEVNRGAVRPGMLVKHKDGMWTASANKRGNADASLNPLSPLLDYCNDAAAAWPIIVDNRISIINLEADEWGARGVADCRSKRAIHQNSLRAAMMVYLQMQESANVQDNPDG